MPTQQTYQGQDAASEKIIFEQKINAIGNCSLQSLPQLFQLIAQRGQIAYHAYQQSNTLSPMDRANIRGQILQLEAQIAALLAIN